MSSREITKELAAKILLHGVIVAHKDVAPQGLISGKHLRWGQCPVPPIRLVKMEVMLKFCVPILHWFVDGPCQSMVIVVRPLRLAVVCYPGGRNPPCLVLTCSSSTHDQLVRHGEKALRGVVLITLGTFFCGVPYKNGEPFWSLDLNQRDRQFHP